MCDLSCFCYQLDMQQQKHGGGAISEQLGRSPVIGRSRFVARHQQLEKMSFLLTYVGVSHQQRRFGVAGLQLDQLLQTGRGHPAHPLPTKCQGLWVPCFCHQLRTEWRLNGVRDSEYITMLCESM